jgi:hypothetical protein
LRLLLQAHGVVNEHPHAVIPMGGKDHSHRIGH